MKKYEYKFVELKAFPGLDWAKKMRETEEQWNELGQEGWRFCMHGGTALVFMRELEE